METKEFDVELSEIEITRGAVRIPDTQPKAVGYVCEVSHREGDAIFGDPDATGFFVSVPCRIARTQQHGDVLLRNGEHVAKNDLKDRDICFSGKTTNLVAFLHDILRIGPMWFLHPTDKSADVATIQVGLRVGSKRRSTNFGERIWSSMTTTRVEYRDR